MHTRLQQIAYVDKTTGEVAARRLDHANGAAGGRFLVRPLRRLGTRGHRPPPGNNRNRIYHGWGRATLARVLPQGLRWVAVKPSFGRILFSFDPRRKKQSKVAEITLLTAKGAHQKETKKAVFNHPHPH